MASSDSHEHPCGPWPRRWSGAVRGPFVPFARALRGGRVWSRTRSVAYGHQKGFPGPAGPAELAIRAPTLGALTSWRNHVQSVRGQASGRSARCACRHARTAAPAAEARDAGVRPCRLRAAGRSRTAPAVSDDAPGADDSVVAKDDHLEGTFTSRGTVVVMGSVKGRVEAVRIRIEDGASVDADVIVDEAIIAGEFTGNLTCRERLEARSSGRINGRVETYKLMLHEGASVEGEMHMLTESPKDAAETIRGTRPLRGETESRTGSQARRRLPRPQPAPGHAVIERQGGIAAVGAAPRWTQRAAAPRPIEATAVRSSVAETLQAESARVVTPRGARPLAAMATPGPRPAASGSDKGTTGSAPPHRVGAGRQRRQVARWRPDTTAPSTAAVCRPARTARRRLGLHDGRQRLSASGPRSGLPWTRRALAPHLREPRAGLRGGAGGGMAR